MHPASRPALILQADRRAGQARACFPLHSACSTLASADALVLLQIEAHARRRVLRRGLSRGRHPDTHAEVSASALRHRARPSIIFSSTPGAPPFTRADAQILSRWESRRVDPEDRDLPALADAWLRDNARFAILTSRKPTKHFPGTRSTSPIGPGRRQFHHVGLSREPLPGGGLFSCSFQPQPMKRIAVTGWAARHIVHYPVSFPMGVDVDEVGDQFEAPAHGGRSTTRSRAGFRRKARTSLRKTARRGDRSRPAMASRKQDLSPNRSQARREKRRFSR